jgi:hypothetical protein
VPFAYFSYFITCIHSFNHNRKYIRHSPGLRFISSSLAGKTCIAAESRIELGPALRATDYVCHAEPLLHMLSLVESLLQEFTLLLLAI